MMFTCEAPETGIRCTRAFLNRAMDSLGMDEERAVHFAEKAQSRGRQLQPGEYAQHPFLSRRDPAKGERVYEYKDWYVVLSDTGVAITFYDNPRLRRQKKPNHARIQFDGKRRIRDAKKCQRYLTGDADDDTL